MSVRVEARRENAARGLRAAARVIETADAPSHADVAELRVALEVLRHTAPDLVGSVRFALQRLEVRWPK